MPVHEEKTVLDEEKSSWLAQLIAANQEADLLRLQLNETENHQGVMNVSDVIASNEENILFPSERSSIIKEQSCQCEELGGYLVLFFYTSSMYYIDCWRCDGFIALVQQSHCYPGQHVKSVIQDLPPLRRVVSNTS
ncbi:hypothetical protein Tsp_15015 [Trichinella spiralis]|uniref:hypothetical protein n=1 Tax=Trichinella spiralis TaxID=6334 RepID=UPI0001EFDEEB|nr:hypothetical protein Tsp_15015 [Trichinella spiralis]